MERKVYKIEPVLEERIWGTQELRNRYQYETTLGNIAEVYNVVALPGHLDNPVTGTGLCLSQFYRENRELFCCGAEEMPVMVCMAHANDYLSIQLHPDDAYARMHTGMRGRPEGWIVLDGPEDNVIEMGHHARTKEEFMEWSKNKEWDKLFRYIHMKPGQYVHVPAGSLHAFCKDAVAVAFSVNADVTYRLYDFDRIDRNTGQPRELHLQQVFDNISIPDEINAFDPPGEFKNGCSYTYFYDEPGVYTSGRIQVEKQGTIQEEAFHFYICAAGEGTLDGTEIKAGETVFVPAGYGPVEAVGRMDLMYVTYREE